MFQSMKHYQMKKKSRWWMKTDRFRSAASTGARINPKSYSPSSPRGGIYGSVYEAGRSVAAHYGYDPEGYAREQLGQKYHHRNWDFYKKNILGRDHYQHIDATFPRFPKQKWPKTSYSKLQEGYPFHKRKFQRWVPDRKYSYSEGRKYKQANKCYRYGRSNWKCHKIYRKSNCNKQCCKHSMLRKLYTSVYSRRSKFYRPKYSRWK